MKSEITNKVSNFNVWATNKNSFARDFSLTQRSHPSVEEVKTAEKLAKSKKRAINDSEKTADVPLGGNRSLQVASWCEYNNEADAQETSLAQYTGVQGTKFSNQGNLLFLIFSNLIARLEM